MSKNNSNIPKNNIKMSKNNSNISKNNINMSKNNSNVPKNNINMSKSENETDKYKNILGSKKPVIILKDILKDVSLTEYIPLHYRIINKLKSINNKKWVSGLKNSKIHFLQNSQLINKSSSKIKKSRYNKRIQKTKLSKEIAKETDIIKNKYVKEKFLCENNFKSDSQKRKYEKILQDDKNLNIMRMLNKFEDNKALDKNKSMKSSKETFDLNTSLSEKEIYNKDFLFNKKQNLALKEKIIQNTEDNNDFRIKQMKLQEKHVNFRPDYLLENSDTQCVNEIQLREEIKDSNNTIDSKKTTRVYQLIDSVNNTRKYKLISNSSFSRENNLEYNNKLVIESNSKNIAFPVVTQEIRQENNVLDIKTGNSYKDTDLLKQKHTYTNQSIKNKNQKRIKLNRSYYTRSCKTECKNVNANESTSLKKDNTSFQKKGTAFQSNTEDQTITTDINNSKILHTDEDVAVENICTQLKDDNTISNCLKQNKVKNSRNIITQSCDSLNNTNQLEPVALQIHKQSMEKQCYVSNNINCYKENIKDDELQESDCKSDSISLFVDSVLIEEFNAENSPDVFQNYNRNSKSDLNKIYMSNVNNNETNMSKIKETNSIIEGNAVLPKKPRFNSIVFDRLDSIKDSKNKMINQSRNIDKPLTIFRSYCYEKLRFGKCSKKKCPYRHDFFLTLIKWYNNDEKYLFKVIENLVMNKFTHFIKNFFSTLLHYHYKSNMKCILKIFKKFCELNLVTVNEAFNTIEQIQRVGYSIELIIEELTDIVNNQDFEFVNLMLKVLKKYIKYGKCWNTLRSLMLKIDNFEPEIIETILEECITMRTYIQDVNVNIMHKLPYEILHKIKYQTLTSFKNLVKCEEIEVSSSQSIASISSPNLNSLEESEIALDENNYLTIRTSTHTAVETNKKSDNNSVQDKDSCFTLHPIDDLPKPCSAYGRIKFWKFYVDVHSLQEGLKHNDYEYVMKILNSVKKDQQSVFTQACYNILCNEIKHSQYYLSNLISYSVQTGATAVSYQILLDVAKCILAHLAEENLWVLAYVLLKKIYIFLQSEIHSHKLDAATIMLFAEIYLANYQIKKAFTLLKQTNIIYSSSDKWKVQSTEKDSSIRIEIITLLLNAFCKTFPKYALFLFYFLTVDQHNNFYPINLTNFVNKLISTFLLKKDHKCIRNIVKWILKYNFTLNAITYRALISTLVHLDMTLAKQLYKIAISLGVYHELQFHPITHLTINCDWTKEEMYLAIQNLMEQLLSNIGIATNHADSNKYSIYLIFENIFPPKEFICGEKRYQHDNRITKVKILMKNVLQKQFDPPILVKLNVDKICKLNGISILRYLKSKYRTA